MYGVYVAKVYKKMTIKKKEDIENNLVTAWWKTKLCFYLGVYKIKNIVQRRLLYMVYLK